MSVVHPAYHCLPNGGQGSFLESGSLRLSCVRVLATVHTLIKQTRLCNTKGLVLTFGRICDRLMDQSINQHNQSNSILRPYNSDCTDFDCASRGTGEDGAKTAGLFGKRQLVVSKRCKGCR